MFSDLISMASEISDKFISSELYKDYLVLLEKIEKDENLKLKITNYKKEQIAFQSKVLANESTSFQDEKRMSVLYTELIMNEDCRKFLKVEAELLKGLNQIYEALGDKIEMVTSFEN